MGRTHFSTQQSGRTSRRDEAAELSPVRRLQRSRRHRSTLRQLDRRALERAGWRTTLEFRENHVRIENGQLIEVDTIWVAEAERDGAVIAATGRSESRAWARLMAAARVSERTPLRSAVDVLDVSVTA